MIRHGESAANAGLPTQSPQSIPLTAKGHEQAAKLAVRIDVAPDLIVVSPFLRTRQTAAPLIAKFPGVPVETWPAQEFTYLDVTRHRGTTEAERAAAVRAYWDRCDPTWIDGDGAESFSEFIERVDAVLRHLRQVGNETVLVFTHGYFMLAVGARRSEPNRLIDRDFMAEFRDTLKRSPPAHTESRLI